MRNQRMERIESKLDVLAWRDLWEAAALLDLTAVELIESIKVVAEAFKAGEHPLQVYMDNIIKETIAQTLARQEARPSTAEGVKIYLPAKDTPKPTTPPEPPEDDEPTDAEMEALAQLVADAQARLGRAP